MSPPRAGGVEGVGANATGGEKPELGGGLHRPIPLYNMSEAC